MAKLIASIVSPFIGPVSAAAAAYPFVVIALMVPFAVIHYRKYGHMHPWRAFLLYGFVFYIITAWFLVLLPLPDVPAGITREAWRALYPGAAEPRLAPFASIVDIVEATTPARQRRALFQLIFNFLLLMPLGAWVRYYRGRTWRRTFLICLGMSIAFELCQLTGNFGFYPGPYRLFDVDDLWLNSGGGALGSFVAAVLMRWKALPDLSRLPGPKDNTIGPFRRFVAVFFDGGAVLVTAVILGGLGLPFGAAGTAAIASWVVVYPLFKGGASFGMGVCRCAVRDASGRDARRWRIAARQLFLSLPFIAAANSSGRDAWLALPSSDSADSGMALLALLVKIAAAAAFLVSAYTFAGSLARKDRRGWLDRKLGTMLANTWMPDTPEAKKRA